MPNQYETNSLDWPVTITLHQRDDGGLRVTSDDLPGLLVSGSDPAAVMAAVYPAIIKILDYLVISTDNVRVKWDQGENYVQYRQSEDEAFEVQGQEAGQTPKRIMKRNLYNWAAKPSPFTTQCLTLLPPETCISWLGQGYVPSTKDYGWRVCVKTLPNHPAGPHRCGWATRTEFTDAILAAIADLEHSTKPKEFLDPNDLGDITL